ncbi:DegT/DnrJ/EryC1/StrS aminotransferase family protein [Zoogloea sp. LCSB751]|uniref:DegT/DnrJ/EryC1/StrS family aminotransferase n=1 Tax=Zoogloea sp. LCSB751 TaxID=1965277 RepID=UPI0009A5466D|nr:DegT/DnrJ/EryC1/StrS family aminotransferase [Zoogloea sp. LCSB751]
MNSFKYPLATSSWDGAEEEAMQRVIRSGMFSMGAEVRAFEEAFAQYIGSRHAVMVNSGSSANLLMVAALFYTKDNPLKRGDEVIVPAVSWSTTYYPLHQYGLKLRFVDVDLNTLNYDLEQLASAISGKTRLVMAVNLLGNPNDFDVIRKLIAGRDIRLIEDNCESMGAEFGGKKAGTFGVMGSFSSFFSHHISTMEGGVVVTDDEELHHILLALRAHGWTRNLPKFNHVCGEKSDDPFKESFRFVLPGYNVRPLELSGAIGVEQVRKLPGLIAERRRNGARLQGALADHPQLLIQRETGRSSWFGFSLVIRPGSKLTREQLIARLAGAGFECRPIVAGNFTKNEVMRFFDAEVHGALDNAEHIDRNGLFVGNHHYPIADAIDELGRLFQ